MFKLLMSMSIPAMLSMLVYALYNIVDSIFVAQLGEDALTAVSLAFPIQMLMISVAVGTGIGINSLVARRLGEGNKKDADSAATHGIVLGAISTLVFVILGLTIVQPFFEMYSKDKDVILMGVQYLSTVMIFSVGCFVEINIEKTLQATGNMMLPMVFMLVGGITNLILDPLFIFGIGIFPELGVLGAGVATVIGQIFSLITATIVLITKKHDVKISFKNFKLNGKTIKDIYAVGVPSIIMQSISSVMILGLNAILITFSETAVSVLGVYFKLQSFVFMPVFGLMQGGMPIMGYNFGAKSKKRLMHCMKLCIITAGIIMVLGTLCFMIFAKELLMMFNASNNMINIGQIALRIICLSFIPAAFGIVVTSMFQAIGKGFHSMIISVLRQLVVLLPVAFALSFVSLDAVWWAFPISEVASLTLAIIFLIRITKRDINTLEKAIKK